VGGEPLALQHRALPHAELVLLVDDDEPEVGELDVLLDQRLRADTRVNLAILQCILEVSFFGSAQ
jgi:hypothetical protein